MENEHEFELPASDAAAVSGEPPTLEREPVAAAVAAPSAPAFADGIARKLEPGWIDVSRVGGLITFGALGVGAFLVLGVVALTGKVPFPLFAILTFALLALVGLVLVLAAIWPKWEHARAGYRFLPDRIECWNGLVWRRSISVPVSRVQYTDVKQGPVQRKYAIATLVVHTAGTLGSDIEFPGLPPELANEVRDWLVGETGSDAV